jgi:hypothetical protein
MCEAPKPLFHSGERRLTGYDLARLCLVAEPRRGDYDAAMRGVFASGLARRLPRELFHLPPRIQRQPNGVLGVIDTGYRIVKQRS